jgi:hypothetical protein
VILLEKNTKEQLTVHHLDHNHENNEPMDLVAAHGGCHSRHHMIGRQNSKSTREKMSAASKGRKHSVETKAAIGASSKERWRDPELRERMMPPLGDEHWKRRRRDPSDISDQRDVVY